MKRENNVFKITDAVDKVICLPDLVFKKSDFIFLFSIGGHIVEDGRQYQMFMKLLKDIGENQFTIKENLGTSSRQAIPAFEATFSVDSILTDFDKKMREFDEHFGVTPYHWFIYGQKDEWGIYISEYPTINIIGCTASLIDRFKTVFKISDNGYAQIKPLLDKEFEVANNPEFKLTFLENYGLSNAPL